MLQQRVHHKTNNLSHHSPSTSRQQLNTTTLSLLPDPIRSSKVFVTLPMINLTLHCPIPHLRIESSPSACSTLLQLFHSRATMCHYYAHAYTCKHTTYALGKYCAEGGMIQTPCKKRNIWQTIRMGEDCEECTVPEPRVGRYAERKEGKGGRKRGAGRGRR